MTTGVTLVVVALIVVVALLAVLVAGLLRSQAAILRRLDEAGMSPWDDEDTLPLVGSTTPTSRTPRPSSSATGRDAPDIAGASPAGNAVAYRVDERRQDTLLLFLSGDCTSCEPFWTAVGDGRAAAVDGADQRLLVITKDPEAELTNTIAARPTDLPIVMSSAAWRDYEVPGSPYFVHVDGPSGRIRGEGTSASWDQFLQLAQRGAVETANTFDEHDHGVTRDSDEELLAAGIRPGDPSLHPSGDAIEAGDP